MDKNSPQVRRLLEDIEKNNSKILTLFSIPGCPACEEFKRKADRLDIQYESIDMSGNDEMWEKIEKMGGKNFVPQVMVEGTLIKNYNNVNELLSKTVSELIKRKVILK